MGGGMPIGAVGGREDVMSQAGGGMGQAAVSGGYGTFNGNPLSMVCLVVSQPDWTPSSSNNHHGCLLLAVRRLLVLPC